MVKGESKRNKKLSPEQLEIHKKIRNEHISAKYWERKKEEDVRREAEEAQRAAEEKKTMGIRGCK